MNKPVTVFLFFFFSFNYCGALLAQNQSSYDRFSREANAFMRLRNYSAAAQSFEKLFATHPLYINHFDRYNAACAWARIGNADKAFEQMFAIVNSIPEDGYADVLYGRFLMYFGDADLQSLVTDDRWDEFRRLIYSKRHPVVNTLDTILLDDQKHRTRLIKDRTAEWKLEQSVLDSINLVRLGKIFKQYGWPSEELIGKGGGTTLWLVLMHADVKAKKKYLPLVRDAVKQRKAKWTLLPILEDRIAVEEGRRQRYGSQLATDERGRYYVMPLENVDSVDVWRKRVGLPAMKYYFKGRNKVWNAEEYKTILPKIETAVTDGRLTLTDG